MVFTASLLIIRDAEFVGSWAWRATGIAQMPQKKKDGSGHSESIFQSGSYCCSNFDPPIIRVVRFATIAAISATSAVSGSSLAPVELARYTRGGLRSPESCSVSCLWIAQTSGFGRPLTDGCELCAKVQKNVLGSGLEVHPATGELCKSTHFF